MLVYHPLLRQLERELQRKVYFVRLEFSERHPSYFLLVEGQCTMPGDYNYWYNTKDRIGKDRWQKLSEKWRANDSTAFGCPTFSDLTNLICWAYEVLCGVQLDPNVVRLALKSVPPTESLDPL